MIRKTAAILASAMLIGSFNPVLAEEVTELEAIVYTTQGTAISEVQFQSNLDFNNLPVYFGEKEIKFDVKPQLVEGIFMIPIRYSLEALGFTVEWKGDTKTVEINKGNFYTTVRIDENYYYKHKMAPIELSAAPVVIDGRTLVPVEFLTEIMECSVAIEDGSLKLSEEANASRSGYIYEILEEADRYTITLTTEKQTKETFNEDTDRTIVSVLKDSSIVNRETLKVDDYITVVHLPYMIMIYPAQTSAIIVY